MLKKFYVFAWLLLVGSTAASIAAGTFDAMALVATSLGALALLYALALWAAFRNTHGITPADR